MRQIVRYLYCTAVAMLLMTSCSHKKDSVLEVIPDDYQMVANIKLAKLTEEAGESLNSVLSVEQREMLSQLDEALCLNDLFIAADDFDEPENEPAAIMAVPVKDEKALKKALGNPKSKNGFTVYDAKSRQIAVKDGIAYVVKDDNLSANLRMIEKNLDECEDNGSMADVKAMKDAFAEGDNFLVLAVSTENEDNEQKAHGDKTVTVVKLKFKDKNTIDFDGYAVYSDGTEFTPKVQMTGVSNDALAYAGSNPLFTAAVGIPGNFDWKYIFKQYNDFIEKFSPKDAIADSDIALLLPLLKSIDGTVMLSVSAKGNITDMAFNVPNITCLVQCKAGTERMLLNMIKMSFKKEMQIDLNLNDDLTPAATTFKDFTVYVGAIDNNVIISTTPPAKSDNKLATAFKGQQLGFVLDLPPLGQIMPPLDTPVNLSMLSDGKTLSGNLTCTDKPVMQVLCELLALVI